MGWVLLSWVFNIHDFEPIVGRIHQPPPVHQTFQGDGFVICSFCPRPYDFDPNAVPAPYNHSNVDSDEVLFYASSEFMSRKGIEYGSHHASPGRPAARPASWPRRGEHRRQVHERARGDDGLIPPAQGGEAGDGLRGSEVPPELGRTAARTVQSADVVRAASGERGFSRRPSTRRPRVGRAACRRHWRRAHAARELPLPPTARL